MKNFTNAIVAIAALGLLAFLTKDSKVTVRCRYNNFDDKVDSVAETLNNQIKELKELGCEEDFFCSTYFRKAEYAYMVYLNDPSEENMKECYKWITKCKETFRFFAS